MYVVKSLDSKVCIPILAGSRPKPGAAPRKRNYFSGPAGNILALFFGDFLAYLFGKIRTTLSRHYLAFLSRNFFTNLSWNILTHLPGYILTLFSWNKCALFSSNVLAFLLWNIITELPLYNPTLLFRNILAFCDRLILTSFPGGDHALSDWLIPTDLSWNRDTVLVRTDLLLDHHRWIHILAGLSSFSRLCVD